MALERILSVDDDPHMLRVVQMAMSKAGYEVMTASSGKEALQVIKRSGMPHLALVDLNMPRMNGFEFAKRVHQFSDMPIIMLTAISDEQTVIEGLHDHAEDYIVKPFSIGVLTARVKNVLNRIGSFEYTLDPLVEVDNRLQIDFPSRKAFVEGEQINLTPTESKLLYLLMRSAGRVVTTDFLLRRIWPMEEAYEDRLHVHVHRLRRKIETNHKNPYYVVSERGAGYTFPRPAGVALA